MNLPNSIPHKIECPHCDNSFSELEYQKSPSGYDYLVYYCQFCKNGWTTSESDDISLSLQKNKIRSKQRKIKIKKHVL